MYIRDTATEGRWWASIDGLTAISKDSHYDGDENVVISEGANIPIRFEVCTVCDGRGEYVNPSIDSHGITGDEMDELGYEFREDYRSGVYNVPCGLCEGSRVIPTPTDKSHTRALNGSAQENYEYQLEREAELRYGY